MAFFSEWLSQIYQLFMKQILTIDSISKTSTSSFNSRRQHSCLLLPRHYHHVCFLSLHFELLTLNFILPSPPLHLSRFFVVTQRLPFSSCDNSRGLGLNLPIKSKIEMEAMNLLHFSWSTIMTKSKVKSFFHTFPAGSKLHCQY